MAEKKLEYFIISLLWTCFFVDRSSQSINIYRQPVLQYSNEYCKYECVWTIKGNALVTNIGHHFDNSEEVDEETVPIFPTNLASWDCKPKSCLEMYHHEMFRSNNFSVKETIIDKNSPTSSTSNTDSSSKDKSLKILIAVCVLQVFIIIFIISGFLFYAFKQTRKQYQPPTESGAFVKRQIGINFSDLISGDTPAISSVTSSPFASIHSPLYDLMRTQQMSSASLSRNACNIQATTSNIMPQKTRLDYVYKQDSNPSYVEIFPSI